MTNRYRLARLGRNWHVMARKGAGAATDAAWVSLGGCPNQMVAVRLWLALVAAKGRQ